MTTIAIPRPIPPHRPASALDVPITPPLSLEEINASIASHKTAAQAPIPNKHIPVCPTGPAAEEPTTPPRSPSEEDDYTQSSLLYPPHDFHSLTRDGAFLFLLDGDNVIDALDYAARQPLPDPSLVFPWFHGLHPQNHIQQAFFAARRRVHRNVPSCLRSVTLVKADGDLSKARLKGAIAPEEILRYDPNPGFIDDPRDGFSVRNFHIQPAKVALVSDIIVYGEVAELAHKVAWDIVAAQRAWREGQIIDGQIGLPRYNTFVCTSSFEEFEKNHAEYVAVDSEGRPTGAVLDLVQQERQEMWMMTEASEISHNVYLGPTPELGTPEEQKFDILIECSDMGRLNPGALELAAHCLVGKISQQFHDFPSSGSILPPTWTHSEADGILETCKWIYHLSHGTRPPREADRDSFMTTDDDEDEDGEEEIQPRKVLIHCADGYTESSMLAVAYYSYSTGLPVPDAWLSLHTAKRRNFFAYPTDVALLTALAPRLLSESPECTGKSLTEITKMIQDEPDWFPGLDGSLPSRVMDYLYLGNLGHANNPDLLREIGIHQILSVGETAMWRDGDMEEWGSANVCVVQGVQDNGIDPLTAEFHRCLEFIERGRRNGTATLVHCRVGVSRSATICIAEVMRALNMSFPRAYCFVRARRLNVIIQPHLRFAYELLKWEETLQKNGDPDAPIKRDAEWGEIAREIALMNRPYAR
ncbi:hypothetical protein NLU13_3632 [Sarocladium strictum]|uniref:Protein-tyrosine-phosphatase n=1 Tax=Sarocladium strictum TaxID=5046 RepID=A0AA39GN55_SARSR|nr:hypothetical protein NLU13_3632 [Sarocladium strictum]